jgi:hypothetical protein
VLLLEAAHAGYEHGHSRKTDKEILRIPNPSIGSDADRSNRRRRLDKKQETTHYKERDESHNAVPSEVAIASSFQGESEACDDKAEEQFTPPIQRKPQEVLGNSRYQSQTGPHGMFDLSREAPQV